MSLRIGEDWLAEYDRMNEGERRHLTRAVNGLLAGSYLVADSVDERTGELRSNPDYRLLDRHFEWVEAYLSIGGWNLEKDRDLGVIQLTSAFDYNRLRLDGLGTLVLYALRLLYDEEREKLSLKTTIILTVWDVIDRLQSFRSVTRRIADKDKQDTFRILARHNLIARLSGQWQEAECRFVVFPSILLAVPSDAIGRIFASLQQAEREGTLLDAAVAPGHENDADEGDAVPIDVEEA